MAEQIGTKGAELNILIRQGTTFGPNTVQLRQADGNFLDITGSTLRGQIRKTSDDGFVQASFSFSITNPTTGLFTWELPPSATKDMYADPESEESPNSTYLYDCEIQLANGKVMPLMYGTCKLFREITKE